MYALTTTLAAKGTVAMLTRLPAAPSPSPAPGGGSSLPGPTCGLPSEVTTMAATFVGWEKGFLAIVAVVAAFACLIMWGLGTAFKMRHVAEAGQTGLFVVFGIVFAAAVVTGLLQVALNYLNC